MIAFLLPEQSARRRLVASMLLRCLVFAVVFPIQSALADAAPPSTKVEGENNNSVNLAETEKASPTIQQLKAATAVLIHGSTPSLKGARGTACFLHEKGLLFTAAHGVLDKDGIPMKDLWILRNVAGLGGRFFKVSVLLTFGNGKEGRDLAILRIDPGQKPPQVPFPALPIGPQPVTGESVTIAGFPLVFDQVYRNPLFRKGWVSSTRFHLRDSKVLVLDVTSVGGFSGAPVVHSQTGDLMAIIKGQATGNPAGDFSLATTVYSEDLEKGLKKLQESTP